MIAQKPALVDDLFREIATRHPRSLKGVEEARHTNPERFDLMADRFLTWLAAVGGRQAISSAVDAFVQFTTEVNLAQARYEASGSYQSKSFAEVYADHYSNDETMEAYLWGVYLTNFLWAHHAEIGVFYEDRFLGSLNNGSAIVEIAPGHGGWGVWALSKLKDARLKAFDISPASINIAKSVALAAGVGPRAEYCERDALDLARMPSESADAVICSFLVEHLEDPGQLFAVVNRLLKSDGIAYVTGALTAAQVDHIYEFRFESELLKLAENNGLRVTESFSGRPRRLLRGAKFVPRSMAMIMRRRVGEFA